ncbi:Rho GTPase activator Rga [Cordyceps fumosorosea ARSEF 2679]|uniref:Rho GTPase activator Rga n=1 Tax=Cordyceps fumosorosea (strain ARSEF 2679) TaxID=1081104 RepID=A0A162K6J5_CORFA|nr:Rho GTPase activator Rga [Cordyceps fumosorosea ARSEF 2679]OAA54018.1 Rho GTPase activator Rga [Cordyceps fumosorosea ARSEF 2679]
MTAVVDEYLDGALDTDEVFPCRGCGEILEEGKAFELANQRWHLDCFRCHSCGTLLDSDANLLLLGDGSLVCNNCTYTCNACGNKIEDLAILTGDQAFCSTCFRCRNCKRKIENLRYARTSQGIFCMGCHETLIARRRKRSKANAAKARDKEDAVITDKSLPALPPEITPTDQGEADSDNAVTTSPRQNTTPRINSNPRAAPIPARSPERPSVDGASNANAAGKETLTLPSSTYRRNRNSAILPSGHGSNQNDSDGFYISVALDPTPNGSAKASPAPDPNNDVSSRNNKASSERRGESAASPHIAFQEKGRQQSADHITQAMAPSRKLSKTDKERNKPSKGSPDTDEIRTPEAPRSKRLQTSRTNSSQSTDTKQPTLPPRPRASHEARSPDDDATASSQDVNSKPSRSGPGLAIARKELPPSANRTLGPAANVVEKPVPNESYMQPRTAPVPPGSRGSVGAKDDGQSPKVSPKLPRWSSGADFTLDEDMARILGTDEGSSSLLRRVSNAVRHGRTGSIESSHNPRQSHTRSISETTRSTVSPRWSRAQHPDDGHSHDISSPVSLAKADDSAMLKRQLRNSEQRVAELERQFNTEKDLQTLDKKLVEKRKTVSVLDTQAEIMIRQLEVLAGYVEKAKETKAPIDVQELEDSAIKDFVKKLERVKATMSSEIASLHERRDKLLEEKHQAIADRDRALMEFEQLSSKNAQLADMNNEMTHQIQERFKSQVGDLRSPSSGLGIYGQRGAASSNANLDAASMTTGATLVPADEEHIVETGPTVVQVRKGQVKKFNWKKGSKTMAQNVAKGVNRAVVAFQQNERERPGQMGGQPGGLTTDNIGLPYNMTVTQADLTPAAVAGPAGLNAANKQQGFGFFGKKTAVPKSVSANTVSTPLAAEPPSVLFGSELTERAEYERRQIPSVVTRCIEEVELRGMDQEGIYRKTGGNSQINQIKEGFEKNENFDISDPDLDITAVTSVLKQYFRKLPMPLLTFDVYDRVLESNAVPEETERCAQLRKTFDSMPQSHRDCLEFLMFHLQRVAHREPENLMSPKNLAVVFAPTIMRDLSIEREMTDMHAKNIAVQFVIENSHIIFEDA